MNTRDELLNWLDANNAFTDSSRRSLTSGITRKIKHSPVILADFQTITRCSSSDPAELIFNVVNPNACCTCEVCENPAPFDKYYNGYKKACSRACASKLTSKKGAATKQALYGDSHYNNSTKNKQTKLERYGSEIFTNAEKSKQTKLIRYGNPNYNNPEKNKQTCLGRYGYEKASQSPSVKAKQRTTMLEKYGVGSPMESEKIKQTYIQNYQANHSADWPLQDRSVRKKFNFQKETSNELAIEEFLKNRGFHYQYRYVCSNKEFDFAVFDGRGSLAVLIETDGEYFHGLLSDCDGKHVQGGKDCERFSQTPEGVKLIVADSKTPKDKVFSEILRVFNLSYQEWIDEIVGNLPEEFPYPAYDSNRMKKDWEHLKTYSYNKYQRLGLSIIRNYHRSIYEAHVSKKPSPLEAWNNKQLLRECVENRFIYSSNLSSQAIADGFNVCKIAPKVSTFNPSLAKHLVEKYLGEFDTVFDPFSGFSGRLLGTCALNKKYIGQDINKDHISETQAIIDFLNLDATVMQQDVLESSGTYPCLFTCPPYGGKEHWNVLNDEVEKSCDEWIDECLARFKCEKYLFVVDTVDKYKDSIVEELETQSHFGKRREYVVLI